MCRGSFSRIFHKKLEELDVHGFIKDIFIPSVHKNVHETEG